ncbi:MAG: hypothetical protein GY953_34540 [bacterium]|nr:hypothetical protein [bacterium]
MAIRYSEEDCTGTTYIAAPDPLPLIFYGTSLYYSAGRCESDGGKICIYSAPIGTTVSLEATPSLSTGTTECILVPAMALYRVVPASEVIKINSPFPWEIK